MKRTMGAILTVTVVAAVAVMGWFWDSDPPSITVDGPNAIGAEATLRINVEDPGKGLKRVQVGIQQGDQEQVVFEETYETPIWPWQTAQLSTTVSISDWKEKGLEQGDFTVSIQAEDQPNLWFLDRSAGLEINRTFDSRPPRIDVISGQHYLHQGGSEVVSYRVDEAGRSGVTVGDTQFVGYPAPGKSDGTMVCIFALAFDASPDQPVLLWAEDEAGNRSESRFFCKTFSERFRQRSLNISESFIASVTPEIFSRTDEVGATGDPLQDFLAVNRDLRIVNNDRIASITRESSPQVLWEEPFLQLTNSQVEAVFADQRSYIFNGEKVDEQVHLGFDLASLAQADVEASNAGRVVHADYLGIYGNTVILEHGLGLYSLYGHLSSIAVEKDQIVNRGQSLGRTGQTGLAGGDHLHFSMIVQGVQVNPVEWWDPSWVENHFLSKVR